MNFFTLWIYKIKNMEILNFGKISNKTTYYSPFFRLHISMATIIKKAKNTNTFINTVKVILSAVSLAESRKKRHQQRTLQLFIQIWCYILWHSGSFFGLKGNVILWKTIWLKDISNNVSVFSLACVKNVKLFYLNQCISSTALRDFRKHKNMKRYW